MMKRLLFWLLLFCLQTTNLWAQRADYVYEDRVYLESIHSVKFHLADLYLTLPVIDLNSSAQLELTFDDLRAQGRTFTYSIIHCDVNWQPSQLTQMEYLDGFSEMPITNYQFSFKTIVPFTHYTLNLPNQDVRWTKSGNYLLVVYDDDRPKHPAITRRFMVVDPLTQIQPQLVRPAQVSKSRTHQEIDFVVDHERLDIRTPMTEVQAVVLQNGRWGSAITGIRPAFTRYRQLVFDHQDKIVFPAGKEFRYLDLRTLRSRTENVAAIERYNDHTDVILAKDEKRLSQSYSFYQDINGQFVIESFDDSNAQLAGDYADVLFSLYSPEPYYDYDVYLVGAMTDWQLRPEFKMAFNERINGYVAKPRLKQGFYNYAYAVVPQGRTDVPPDLSELEGDWFETENEYTLLVYYRPFGSRYDQLIGARSFNFNPR